MTKYEKSGIARAALLFSGHSPVHKLRGSGNTFSTSGQRWYPFNFNPHLATKKAKLHRIKRKGLSPPGDKASLRQAANLAAETHPISKVQTSETRFKP